MDSLGRPSKPYGNMDSLGLRSPPPQPYGNMDSLGRPSLPSQPYRNMDSLGRPWPSSQPQVNTDSVQSLLRLIDAVQLPKTELHTFDGDPLQYWAFILSFDNTVGNKDVEDSAKLMRLLQYCKG